MAHTAPPGYDSNHSAILEFIRFAPGIWTPSQILALMFHIERSTAYGKESDQHSEGQALDGIYSDRSLSWVRGPAGLSRSTWYRTNRELEIDPEDPAKTPNGVIRRHRHESGNQVTEYEIDWKAFKRRIAIWKETHQSQSETGKHQSTRLSLTPHPSQFETGTPTDSKRETQKYPSQPDTHSQTLTLKSDSHSPSDATSRKAIAEAIEAATGERPRTDRLINQVLEVGQKLHLPAECLDRWIHDFCHDRRASGYRVEAGLLGKAAGQDLIPWMRKNEHFISECQRRELARNATAEVKQMPAATEPPATEADPQFSRELLGEVQRKRRGAGR